MAIYKAMKHDLGTGSITGGNEQSYVVPYYVYTDNTDTPKQIYDQAISTSGIPLVDVNNNVLDEKLPTYGTVTSNLYVSNINIERVSENNLTAVPQYGLNSRSNVSYTCWQYTVTYSCSDITFSSGTEKPWDKDEAISCSWSPKSYDRYDNRTLVPNYTAPNDTVKVPNYPLGKEKYTVLKNTVGDDQYRNRAVYNYLLNFSYAVKYFDSEWLPLYLNSMNLNDMIIAGIPVKKYYAVINDMRVSQAEYDNELYYNVDVEIEIQYQQMLTWDDNISNGHRAFMIEGSKTAIHDYLVNTLKLKVPEDAPTGTTVEEIAGFVYKYTNASTIKKYPVPIQELTDTRQRDKIPDKRWFSKKKGYGYFTNLHQIQKSFTKTVPLTRRCYLVSGTIGESDLTISYTNPLVYSDYESVALYITPLQETDDGYVYSTIDHGSWDEEEYTKKELRYVKQVEYLLPDGTRETRCLVTSYVSRVIQNVDENDPLIGQYESVQEPVALTKFGGLYFAKGETSTLDDGNTPALIDMYDPMLGKVKDYQHVARDWSALKFPRKGMFHTDADGIKMDMSKGSTFFS